MHREFWWEISWEGPHGKTSTQENTPRLSFGCKACMWMEVVQGRDKWRDLILEVLNHRGFLPC
jgi:hypothetical protein